ncbi:hypothetical protein [Halovivax sp.]|uniref:hypothetical protein n=1 Tax=Halovivax sp. TaxID=1935978 RepID=UPI0025C06ABB|nr:hypothetical protein [Halovivax sp.]
MKHATPSPSDTRESPSKHDGADEPGSGVADGTSAVRADRGREDDLDATEGLRGALPALPESTLPRPWPEPARDLTLDVHGDLRAETVAGITPLHSPDEATDADVRQAIETVE